MHAHARFTGPALPDLFGARAKAPVQHPGEETEFEGVLLHNAEVRSRLGDDKLHFIPVVCMDLKSLPGTPHRTCHAELPFTEGTRRQAEELAKSLKKGRVITVATPAAEVRLVFPHVNSLSLKPEHPAP